MELLLIFGWSLGRLLIIGPLSRRFTFTKLRDSSFYYTARRMISAENGFPWAG
jgi:hypothetical protein